MTLEEWRAKKLPPDFDQRRGRCYELAAKCSIDLGLTHAHLVVHGVVRWQESEPFPHAWVVLSDGRCYDPVLDQIYEATEFATLFRPVEKRRFNRRDVTERTIAMLATGQDFSSW